MSTIKYALLHTRALNGVRRCPGCDDKPFAQSSLGERLHEPSVTKVRSPPKTFTARAGATVLTLCGVTSTVSRGHVLPSSTRVSWIPPHGSLCAAEFDAAVIEGHIRPLAARVGTLRHVARTRHHVLRFQRVCPTLNKLGKHCSPSQRRCKTNLFTALGNPSGSILLARCDDVPPRCSHLAIRVGVGDDLSGKLRVLCIGRFPLLQGFPFGLSMVPPSPPPPRMRGVSF